MKIAPIFIATLASLPIANATGGKDTETPLQNRTLNLELNGLNEQEEQKPFHFFRFKREEGSGKILIEAEKSTEKIVEYLKKNKLNEEQIKQITLTIKILEEQFNRTVLSKTQIEIGLSDITKAKELPKDLKTLKDEKVRTQHDVLTPSKRDYLDTVDEVLDLFNSDGSIYPLSILQSLDMMTAHGFPLSVFVRGDLGFSKDSLKEKYYIDPASGVLVKGIYFELVEKEGPLGPGGKNGVLAPIEGLPLVVVTQSEVYFIGVSGLERAIFVPNQRNPQQERLPFPKDPFSGVLNNPVHLPFQVR